MKPKKQTKGYIIKARVSQRIKDAVVAAASNGEAEAVVIREALGEYLVRRGFLQQQPQPPYSVKPKRTSAPSKPHKP